MEGWIVLRSIETKKKKKVNFFFPYSKFYPKMHMKHQRDLTKLAAIQKPTC